MLFFRWWIRSKYIVCNFRKDQNKTIYQICMKHSSDATCLIYSSNDLSAKLRTAATIARVWPSLVPPIIAMSHTLITLIITTLPYLHSTFLSYICLPLRSFPIWIFWDLWTRPPKVIEGFKSYKKPHQISYIVLHLDKIFRAILSDVFFVESHNDNLVILRFEQIFDAIIIKTLNNFQN